MLKQTPDGKWKADSPTMPASRRWASTYDVVYGNKRHTVAFPADADAFERGQTAMFIRESWVIGDIAAKAPDLNYATTTLPMGSIVAADRPLVPAPARMPKAERPGTSPGRDQPENLLWMLTTSAGCPTAPVSTIRR